jgi:hypothetical protein
MRHGADPRVALAGVLGVSAEDHSDEGDRTIRIASIAAYRVLI